MKLIKLAILNLASLDKEGGEVINFEEGALRDSSIFSIVGPTGSGKSTILDAICLALYNRAPRYPRIKGQKKKIEIYGDPDELEKNRLSPTDCRNILTKGKKEGYSKLTFVANNQCVYRAEWHVRFKVKNFENAITTLYKLSKDGTTEEEAQWEDLPNIIGLDYDQFLRTVLIAQGSFANFLSADEEERYQLLEKLIGCEEMYSRIAEEIKTRKDAAVHEFERMADSIDAVKKNLLSEEELAKLDAEILQMEESEKQLSTLLKEVENELQWYADDDKKAGEILKQEGLLSEKLQVLDKSRDLFDRLDLHDALEPAINLFREKKRLEKEIYDDNTSIRKKEDEIRQNEEKKKDEADALTKLENNAGEIKRRTEEAAPRIRKARELLTKMESGKRALDEKAARKSAAEKEFENANKAVEENKKQIEKALGTVKTTTAKADAIGKEVEQRKEELRLAAETAGEKLDIKKKELEGVNAEELQNIRSSADQTLMDFERAMEIIGTLNASTDEGNRKEKRLDQLRERNLQIDGELPGLDTENLSKEVETLRNTHTLMISEQWTLHRTSLEEGHPCPLCGSTTHPYKRDAHKFDATESELKTLLDSKERTLREQTDKRRKLSEEKAANETEKELFSQRLRELKTAIEGAEEQWKHLQGLHPEFPKAKERLEAIKPCLVKQQSDATAALRNFNNAQNEVNSLTRLKTTADNNRLAYEQESSKQKTEAERALTDAGNELTRVTALTQNLIKQQTEKQTAFNQAVAEHKNAGDVLKALSDEYKKELNGEGPDEVEQRLREEIEKNGTAISGKRELIGKLEAAIEETRKTVLGLKEQFEAKTGLLNATAGKLESWVNAYNRGEGRIRTIDIAVVEEAANENKQWDEIRQKKKECRDAVVTARTLRDNAHTSREEHQKTKPQSTIEELRERQRRLQESSRRDQLVEAKAKRRSHDNALEQIGDKAETLSQLTKGKEDWTAITDAIGGDGKTLRKIAQCYTLRFLIEHSNAEIRKFNSRYELQQVKNSLGIRVIDHDRADDVRDTTSLSGGETFIVSLGLALGLSSLSSRNISFENLFIDEGFGTLDPDTLATVIDSLAMLQSKQGKKVGVISHTDTMSERITTQIRIVKNGNSGSSHIEIYP